MKTNNNITSFKQLLLTVVALLVMAGCSSDSWEGTPDALTHEVEPVPIRLSVKGNVVITSDAAMTNIKPHVVAGAVTNTLVNGQEVGIFVIDAATLVDMQSGIEFTSDYSIAYANVKGRITVDGGDTQITALDAEGNPTTLYYPKVKETTVYVLVYAPYKEGITLKQFRNGFDFTVQTSQGSYTEYQQSDLLVGWTKVSTTNSFREQSTTSLSLRHALSRIGLDLNYGGDGGYKHIEGALSGAQASASLCNVYTTATVKLYSTILTADNSSSSSTNAEVVIDGVSDAAASISMGVKNSFADIAFNSLENTLYCIVPPQVVNGEGTEQKAAFSVVVSKDGNSKSTVGTLKNKTFEGGKSYNYTFPWTDLANREPTSITHLEVRNFR